MFGAGTEPQPGASDREERATGTDAQLTRGLVIAGIGGLGLLALIASVWATSGGPVGPAGPEPGPGVTPAVRAIGSVMS